MKRYLVFAGSFYYPSGGAKDLEGSFDHFSDAENQMQQSMQEDYNDWAHIYDVVEDAIIRTYVPN